MAIYKYKIKDKKGNSKTVMANSPKQALEKLLKRNVERVNNELDAEYEVFLVDGKVKSVSYFCVERLIEDNTYWYMKGGKLRKGIRELLDRFYYDLSEDGTLYIYSPNDMILGTLEDCGNMSKSELSKLVDEVVLDSFYFRNYYESIVTKL